MAKASARECADVSSLLFVVLCIPLVSWTPTACVAISSLCFEKISNTAGLYFQEHPAGKKAVVAMQTGQMYLVTLPAVGSNKSSTTISTYLDLSSRVSSHTETGLLSFAFHPKFSNNGRFFVSYICDSSKVPDCKARCGCNPKVGCRVGKRSAGCNLVTIVAEYFAGRRPLSTRKLQPKEVRRILSFARPYINHNGGHIFFGKDGMLYYTSGDGGNQGDPWKLAQNPNSEFGKIMRINVNYRTNKNSYIIPKSNPFVGTKYNPKIWALGLRNPWRCHENPNNGILACGDVGQDTDEEINVIKPGFNYQWNRFEGPLLYHPTSKLTVGTSQGPLFSYTHDSLGNVGCVIGGVFHTSPLNPCLKNRYLYSDYSGPIWLATIGTRSSTSRVSFFCSPSSPMACPPGGNGSETEWGMGYSWGSDLSGNSYLLTDQGIFRLAKQSSCGIKC